jgi:hypothetical protein
MLSIGQIWHSKTFKHCTLEVLDFDQDMCYTTIVHSPTFRENAIFPKSYITNNYVLAV